MSFDLTNKNIQDTFQNLLQRTGSDNRLYDLTGNEIGDLKISGSLTAQQYVVSSSVTNITTQELSGSTTFGNSSDDTHLFTGNITASGNISSSGTIIGSNISGTNTGDQDLSGLALKTEVSGAFTSDSASFSTRISVNEVITARTLVSSSTQIASDISGSFTAASSSFSTRVSANEVITAKTLVSSSAQIASDISGSSTTLSSSLSTRVAANEVITARTLVSSSTQIADDISGSFTSTSSSLSTRLATAESELNNTLISSSLQFDSSDNVTFNNITASGNMALGTGGGVHELSFGNSSTLKQILNNNTGFQFTSGSTVMGTFADATGNFGIGTETPGQKLEVVGNISASGQLIAKGANFNDESITNVGTITLDAIEDDASGGDTKIEINGTTMNIDVGGSTILETTATTAKFNVPIETTSHITASGEISASGRVTTLQVGKDSTDQIDFSTDNVLIFRTGNNNRLRLTTGALRPNAAGGIKLGTTSTPFGALHLQGDITASGNISASGDVLNSQVVQMTNSSSVINTFNTGSHQTCKYVLQVTSGSFIQSSEMLVVQSGSNAFNTEYAQIGTAVNLGSFSTSVSGNVVKLNFAGDFISCSVKFNRTLI